MDFFADNIEISIVNVETARPIPNIAIYVRLFAKHKNDYFMTYISNESGKIIINKSELLSEIVKYKDMFPMDYSSDLEDCTSNIEIVLMQKSDITNKIKTMREWKDLLNIQNDEIAKLENVKNELYFPISKIIELGGRKSIRTTLEIKTQK
ncbi:MAG: hypothetical protein E7255_15870 [Lachnospiraceae bacterium]|jgi:hypothetical protein|nr:hypothetical protein [Lachnospiraceae bacterium]